MDVCIQALGSAAGLAKHKPETALSSHTGPASLSSETGELDSYE